MAPKSRNPIFDPDLEHTQALVPRTIVGFAADVGPAARATVEAAVHS